MTTRRTINKWTLGVGGVIGVPLIAIAIAGAVAGETPTTAPAPAPAYSQVEDFADGNADITEPGIYAWEGDEDTRATWSISGDPDNDGDPNNDFKTVWGGGKKHRLVEGGVIIVRNADSITKIG
jgi:hypothetical protein